MRWIDMRATGALLVCAMLMAAAGVLATPGSAWAMAIFLRIQNGQGGLLVEGDSTVQGHEGEIELLGVSFKVTNPVSIGSASGGAGSGKASFSEIVVTKRVDKASPKLFLATAMATHYPQALITFFDTNKKGQLLLRFTIELTLVFVSSYQDGGNLDGLSESISFSVGQIKLTEAASGETAVWNQVTNSQE